MMTITNVTLDAYNILIGLILFVSIYTRHIVNDNVKRWFKVMVMINILMAAMDICTMVFEGTAHPIYSILLPASMFLFYIFSYFVLIAAGIEIMFFIKQEKFKKGFLNVIKVATVIYFILLLLTPFTNLLYEIDENNVYSRGKYFFIALVIQVILYLNLIIYILANRKSISRAKVGVILMFVLFPQIMQVIQLLFYGISLINTGFTVAFLTMFIQSNRDLEKSLNYIEDELDIKESELNEKVSEIESSKLQFIKMQNHTIESLSNLVENRDEDTGEHVRRTRAYVELLAVQMMKNGHYPDVLTPRFIRFLKRAAPMHDIGKIVVPDEILKKPGRLTKPEFEQIKRHAAEGGRIVHEILDGYEDPEYIQITADIATHHHEKWDGTGYPEGLKGEEIPLCARIMAIADVFDALVSPRIYKSPMSYDEAFQIIESGSGTHFDPIVVKEFLEIREKNAAVNESFKVIP